MRRDVHRLRAVAGGRVWGCGMSNRLLVVARAVYRLVSEWWKPQTPVTGLVATEPTSGTTRENRRSPPPEPTGEFYFREAILDRLPQYFRFLKRMRQSDPDAYGLYREVGASLMPDDAWSFENEGQLGSWFNHTRPAFGAVMLGWKPDTKDKVWPRFLYFTKYKPGKVSPTVQRSPACGDVYELSMYIDDTYPGRKRVGRIATSYPIHVDAQGRVTPLRQLHSWQEPVRAKQGPSRGQLFHVPRREWAFHSYFRECAREQGLTPEEYLKNLFCITANSIELSQVSMIRVDIEKDGMHAVIGVNIKRTPYFFKDRNVTINDKGSRRRIFHIVRPHIRKSGSSVKMHFRGERQFVWNDYQVTVSVPGRHHIETRDLSVPGELRDPDRADGTMTMPELGHMIRERILDRPNV